MKFNFCPICGGKLKEKYSWDEGGVPYCPNDDKMFFNVPNPCIMAAVIKEDEILLLKQSYIYKNSKVLISGYIGIDERAEETVYREVLEETGIKVKNIEFLGTDFIQNKELLMLTFKADYDSGILTKSDEVEMASWEKLNSALDQMTEDIVGQKVVSKVLKMKELGM